MGILSEKSYFCALSVTFLMLGCILKLEGLLQGYVKWKTQWRLMSTFWHKMSGLGLVISNLYGDIVRKIIFLCPLRYIFEARVHFRDWKVSFKAMLSGKTQWRLMSTFSHKMSGLGLVISNLYGDIVRKIIFLCPLRYIFDAWVHFKVGRSPSRLC